MEGHLDIQAKVGCHVQLRLPWATRVLMYDSSCVLCSYFSKEVLDNKYVTSWFGFQMHLLLCLPLANRNDTGACEISFCHFSFYFLRKKRITEKQESSKWSSVPLVETPFQANLDSKGRFFPMWILEDIAFGIQTSRYCLLKDLVNTFHLASLLLWMD